MKKYFIIIFVINFFSILSSPLCIQSKNNCLKCNPLTNLCILCFIEDILVPDLNGGCKYSEKCITFKNHCLECDQEEKLCKKCEDDYYPDENGACTYAMNCLISNKGECLECKEGYLLVEKTKLCKSKLSDDFKNCKLINNEEGTCASCEEGYYLGFGDRKCSRTEYCSESIFGTCTSCNYLYYLNKKENKCLYKNGTFLHCQQTLDGENCDICESGSFFDEDGICVKSQFCSKSKEGICEKCISGYYLSNSNKVCSNTENCFFSDEDTSLCFECNKKFYLDTKDYKCKSNLMEKEYKFCTKVVEDICVSCEGGYYLGKDNKCTSTPHCEESENSKCKLCSENYYLGLDNYCSSIEHCIYTQYHDCIECEDGYYLNPAEKKCIESKGVEGLENCKSACYYPKGVCCECKKDHYLNSNRTSCINNEEEGPYYKCSLVDENEKCYKCQEGYYLGSEDRKCTLLSNCKRSENNICLECERFYCLDVKKNLCVLNDFLYNETDKIYFSCNKLNEEGTACEDCIEGYTINEEGYCVNFEDCEEIKDGICVKCNEYLDYGIFYCANNYFGCVEQYFGNCTRCDNLTDLDSCTECKEGFIINSYGWCIENN